MIVFNPIINIAIITLLGLFAVAFTITTYLKVGTRLSAGKKAFLIFSRLTGICLLILILLEPSIQKNDPLQKEERSFGIALDTSKSMQQTDMDGQKRIDFARNLALEEANAGETPIKYFAFDDSSRPLSKENLETLEANGKDTRFHDALTELFNSQNNYSMKDLVLLTDGHDFQEEAITATGRQALARHCKIYALPIGHKGRVRDLHIQLSSSQNIIFKGNKVSLTAHIRALSCEYEKVNVSLRKNGIVIENRVIHLGDKADHTLNFECLEDKAGISDYEVNVTKLDAEVDHDNNHYVIFVNCIDRQMKALLLEGEPHWDSTFLRRFLNKNKMVNLDSFTQYREGKISSLTVKPETKMPRTLKEFMNYDLILLGKKIDTMLGEKSVIELKKYVNSHGGVAIFTRGNAFESDSGKALQPVEWDEEGYDKVILKATSEGRKLSLLKQLDEIADDNARGLAPPLALSRKIALKKPFTKFLAIAEDNNYDNSQALVYRRFGKGQVLSFGVEGIWHWRFNKSYDVNFDYYASFWDQSIIWLVHNSEFIPGSKFTFRQDASNIELGQKVNFRFSIRNPEDIPSSPPVVRIKTSKGATHDVTLSNKDVNAEHRFTGSFTPTALGRYDVSLVDPTGKSHERKFLISYNSLEEKEVGIDPEYLSSLCLATGGRLITKDEFKNLSALIDTQADQVEQDRVHLEAIWDSAWVLWFICLFFGLDWFYRRKWGLC
ncbi:MAG: hypothetical protein MK132_09520 [Lentisphaerales bacterium]|nr:hypothetical protein [Lentisphaerales bacterium]